ncbi:hypothetical protein ASPBRDRAFT_57680 [Aspergillus brasiliensis CBS 101740]|uniref:Uncharacterized protein n=1 Tax=Aspergillus brasiliensis (strain CBS 101740 / IMI 381727 / IBT 21946) TaxID=767769 RepID=A0A1L9UC05_ASPBC|nr:hypothetical protein ASPBRDRAFT_57680 [Aspergillus brasiliensis CBS 101740]
MARNPACIFASPCIPAFHRRAHRPRNTAMTSQGLRHNQSQLVKAIDGFQCSAGLVNLSHRDGDPPVNPRIDLLWTFLEAGRKNRDTDTYRPDSCETRCPHENRMVQAVLPGGFEHDCYDLALGMVYMCSTPATVAIGAFYKALRSCWLSGLASTPGVLGLQSSTEDAGPSITASAALIVTFPMLAMSATMLTTSTTKTVVTTVTTTYVQVFEGNIAFHDLFSFLAGSIVDVDTMEGRTTIGVNCVHSLLANCSMEAAGIPDTITIGPSTYIHSSSDTEQNSQYYTIWIDSRVCRIFSSTQSASCESYTSYWYSDSITSTSMDSIRTTTWEAAEINYYRLSITAGAEKLLPPVTTTQTQKGTATVSTSTALTSTTAAASSPRPVPEIHYSKAWIAGPIVGAVAGCGLMAAAVYWCLRRKRQIEPSAGSGPTIQDPSEEIRGLGSPTKSTYKADMPAETQGTPVAELPANEPSCFQHTS